MGRNAAFGRPRRYDPLRLWWYATSSRSRLNAVLVVAVGGLVVALLVAATSHDSSRTPSRANGTLRQLSDEPGFNPRSTVVLGGLRSAGAPATPADPSGSTSTSTTTTVVAAATVVAAIPTSSTARVATTTTVRAPATTVPTGGVVFSPPPTPTPTVTTTPPDTVAPTPPTTTTTPPQTTTTAPPPPATTTTTAPAVALPRALPPLLGPG